MLARLANMPLMLVLTGIAAAAMYAPAAYALAHENHHEARSYFYAGTLFLGLTGLVGIAMSGRPRHQSALRQLLALAAVFTVLPLMLAVPFYEAVGSTSFLNAYFEMVSSVTTTGATLFEGDGRVSDASHLWRAMVGWLGGLLMWIAAAAILAPLNLGGFEVTATAEPGQGETRVQMTVASPAKRMARTTARLLPVYLGLTGVLWICLMIVGDRPLVAICHAMSVMATSGISPVGGLQGGGAGIAGEMLVFCFLFFALSRLTFSTDTITSARQGIHHDPEFRLGLALVVGVPMLLFLRHWLGAYEFDDEQNWQAGLRALWGGMFTVLSFLSTTGFESADWAAAQDWSGLGTPGLILLGLSLIGGGVATTAGGVKLLRVFALYLNGLREIERLVHPNSVGRANVHRRRLRRQGAFIAWIFFMLFALSLALVTCVLAALGQGFESAIVLSISALSTTGPLITAAPEIPVDLDSLSVQAKLVLCAAMVLGRLETLALVALLTTDLWRD